MGLNHIYKVIWSKTKNAWVVVSEIAKRDGKSSVKSVVTSLAGKSVAAVMVAMVMCGGVASADTQYGTGATASQGRATAIGENADANKTGATAIGYGAKSLAEEAIAIGDYATANSGSAISIGTANATGLKSIAIGTSTMTKDESSVAIGNSAVVMKSHGIAIGTSTQAQDFGSVVIGRAAYAKGIAIGDGSFDTGGGVALGHGAKSQGSGIGIGWGAQSTSGISLGNYATGSDGSVSIGIGSNAYDHSIAIGESATVNGSYSISMGLRNIVKSDKSGAIGYQSHMDNDAIETYVLGNTNGDASNLIKAKNSGIFGNSNQTGQSTITGIRVIGNNNTVKSSNVMVMGNNVTVDTGYDGAVVLGHQSATQAYTNPTDTTVSGLTLSASRYAGKGGSLAQGSILSIGDTNKERQIKNVAAGVISATSTDAINGSQLYEAVRAVTAGASPDVYMHVNDGTSTQGAGNASANLGKANEKGGATGNYSIAIGTGASALRDRAVAINGTAVGEQSISIGGRNESDNSVAIGGQSIITNGGNNAVSILGRIGYNYYYGSGTLGTTNDLKNSIAIGNNTKAYSSNTVVIGSYDKEPLLNKPGPTGVFSQLKTNPNDLITPTKISNQSMYSGALATTYAEGTLNNSVYLGHESYAFTPDALVDDESHLTGEQSIHTKKYDATGNVVVSNNTTGGAFGKVSKATINGDEITGFAGAQSVGAVTIGAGDYERRIQNVAAGEVSATSTDGINGSQLYAVANTLSKNMSSYMHINDGTGTQAVGNATTNYGYSGSKAGATGTKAIAGGVNAQATRDNGIALGADALSSGRGAITIGHSARNESDYNITIGESSTIDNNSIDSIAMGRNSTITDSIRSITIGLDNSMTKSASVTGTLEGGIAIGTKNKLLDSSTALSLGTGNKITNSGEALVIGNGGEAKDSKASIVMGVGAKAENALIGVAIGNGAQALNKRTVAIGAGAKAEGEQSISIGSGNEVKGNKSSAIGDPSYIDTTATGTHVHGNDNGTATNPIKASESTFMGNTNLAGTAGTTGIHVVGNNNSVDSSNVMVMGNGVNVGTGLDGAVVLGNASSADQYAAATDSTINGVTFEAAGYAGNTGLNNGSIVSVGATGVERQIKNVAAGAVTATSTDAVNGSQLYKTAETILKMPINMAGDSGDTVGLKLGKTVNIKGSVTSGADVTDGNIAVVGDKATSTLSLKMAKNLTGLTSGTFTDATGNQTVINGVGVTVTPTGTGATPISITTSGINAGNQEIKGVKKGTTDDAAVNKKQMDDALAGISSTLTINDGTTDGSVNIKTGKLKVVGESGANALVTTTVSGDTITVGTSTKLQNAVTAAEKSADKDLSNLSATGSGTVKTLAQDAVKVAGTGLATVSDATAAGVKTYTVNVDEGKLVIDDTTGKIGAAGASQGTVQGKDGVATTQNVASVVNSAIDKTKQALDDAKHNFAGDDATVISRKHGEQLNIKGGASTTATDLTSGNIAVVGDTTSGTLNIKMAKALTGLTSATYTDGSGNTQTVTGGSSTIADAAGNSTVVSKGGVTTTDGTNTTTVAPSGVTATDGTHTVTLGGAGISAGGTEIKNVGKATTDDAAVNKKQMDDALKGATDNTVSLGSESGSTTAKKLSTTGGIKFNIKGETGANALITTSATGDDVTVAPTAKLTAAVTAAENAANKDLSNLSAAGDTYIKNLAKTAASWKVETNGAGTTAVAGGETVNFIDGDNIAITNTGRSITIGTAKNVSFDKVTVGGVVIDKTDGINAGGKEIKGVATGTAADSAVNKAQMDAAITAAASGSLSTEKVVAKTLTGDNNLATVTGQTGTAKGETYEVVVSENAVKSVAANAAQDAVKVAGTGLATVSDATAAGVKTYTVNVDEGKLVIDDTTGKIGANGATQGTVQGKNGVATTQNVASVVNSAIDKTKQALDDAKHNFAGDDATVISRKHGEQLNIKGGASTTATDLTSGNIAVVGDTTSGTLNIKMAKALTGLTSATYTDGSGNTQTVTGGSSTIADAAGNSTVVSKGGVTTTDGTNTTTVAPSGVTATDGTHTVTLGGAGISAGGTEIKNVGKATTDDAAVNKKQMDDALKGATDNTVSLGSESGSTTAKKLSTTGGIKFNIKGETGANALITTSATGDDVTIAPTAKLTAAVTAAEKSADKDLSNISPAGETVIKNLAATSAQDAVKVTGTGLANVTDSTTGGVKTYNVDVKTGNLVVTAAGQAGAAGTTGAGGAAGADGVATTQNVASAINDAITKSKTDTAQAIADAEHKFDGDTGTTSVRKHGEVLSVKGGVTATTDLTTGNIGVVSDGAGTLNIRLAKVLSGLTSATYTDGAGNTQTVTGGSSTITDGTGNTTTITKGGMTTTDGTNTTTVSPAGVTAIDGTNTVKLNGSGIDAGNTQIKNVGKATTDDAAVNKKQMDDAVKAATDSISTLGDNKVSLGSDSGTTTAKKLSTTGGIKFNIKGETGANALITTSATGDDVTIAPTAKLTAAVTAAEKSADKDLSNLSAAGDTYIKNLAKTAASWNVETNGAGTTAVAGGDTVDFINGDNIAITNTGRSITIGTAKNVSFDKVTVGGIVLDKNTGINAGGKEIKGVANATSADAAVNKGQLDAAVLSAAGGALSIEKVEAGSVANGKLAAGDNNLASVSGLTGTAKNETYTVTVSENAVKAVAQTAAQDAVKVAGTGLATVSDATAAGVKTYTVNVDEGKLVIDDTTGKIGANGATQGTVQGKNGVATTQNVASVVNSAIDKTKQALDDAKHNFAGDDATVISRKHGEQLNIKGGASTTATDLTSGNIAVVGDTTTGTLNIKLAKALTGLTSATYTDAAGNTQTVTGGSSTITDGAGNTTTITKGGMTTTDGTNTTTVAPAGVTATDGTNTVKLNGSGIDAGNTQIKNVGKATTDDAAVNKKQMDDAVKAATDSISTLGDNKVSLGSDSGTTTAKKLSTTGGIKFNIKGDTGANALITTSATGDDVTIAPTAKLTAAVTAAEKSADKDLSNISPAGETVIKNLAATSAQDAVKVTGTGLANVTDSTTGGVKTYNVDVKTGNLVVTAAGQAGAAGTTGAGGAAGADGVATTQNVASAINDAITKSKTDTAQAIADAEHKFDGDTGTTSVRKHGEVLSVKGGVTATTDLTTGNIGVVSDGAGTLNIRLAKVLSGLTSASFTNAGGDSTVINGNGVTITPSATGASPISMTTAGINAGNKEIKGVANATSADAAVNKGQMDAAITAAAGGSLSTEKVVAKTLTGDNNLVTVTGQTGTAKGETYEVAVSENAVKAVAQTAAQDAVKVTGTGLANVTDSTTGGVKTYNVDVKTGNLVVTAAGQAGAAGTTGAGGAAGADGVATTQNVASAINDAITKSKTDTAQAIADAEHKFDGDTGTTSVRKHGEVLSVKGGVTATTDLTTGNIGVVSDGAGTLNIRLAKVLSGLTSATYTDAAGNTQTVTGGSSTITDSAGNTTTITKGGMTTTDGTNTTTVAPAGVTATDGTNTVKLTGSGIDAGNTQIKNVGKATTDDAAVNKKQMDDAVKAATDSISTLGDNKVSLGSDSGTTTAKKLSTTGGIKFNIKGDTGANALITTSATGDDVTIAPTAKLTAAVTAAEKSADKDLSNISPAGETVIKNLAATSAQDAVKVTGTGLANVTDSTTGGVKTYNVDVKTGNLVVTAAGQAGAAGTTGAGGAAGADGVATTQNVASAINDAITKSKTDTAQAIADAEHKFDGDTGTTSVRKHGEVLSVKGGVTATTDLTTGNIGVVSDGAGTLNIRLAKVLSGLTSASFTNAGGDSTVINGNGVTITPSATGASPISMTTAGINAGNKEIKGVANATSADAAVNKGQMDAAITAAAGGSLSTEKVVAKTLTGDNNLVTVTGQTGTAKGETYEVAVSENAVKAVAQTAAQDAVKVTGTGLANVTDSTTGGVKTYNVDVKTGNLVVTAAGQAGAAGTTGAGGAAGADGVATTQNVASAINDAITKSKTDTAQAIADAEHKFDGDTGTTSVRKHGEVLSVKGGVTATTDLTTGNIGVVSDGAGTLNIRLAKVLSGLTSATYTDAAGNTQTVTGGSSTITDGAGNTTTITKGGMTTTDGTNTTTVAPAGVTATDGTNTVKLNGSGIDAGNTQIKNVGKATTDDAAVNKKQMDDAVKAATDSISTLGDNKVSLGSDSGTTTAKKLSTTGGIKFNIKGDTGANALITTSATGDDVTIAPTAKLSAAVTAAENSANKDLSNLSAAGDTYIKNLAKTAASWNVETNGAGTTAVAGGDTVNFINGDNIAITNTGRSITIGTAKNVSFDKVTVGGVVIDKNNGIDAGGKEITNVGPATSGNSAVNKTQMDTAIANAQTAATSTEKVVAKTLTGDTNLVTVTGQTGTAKGETYEVAVSENAVKAVAQTAAQDAVKVTGTGLANVTDSTTGGVKTYNVDVKTGNLVVTAAGQAGAAGTTGAGGAAGADGVATTQNVASAINDAITKSKTDTAQAIADAEHKFDGDTGTTSVRKHGEVLSVKGGVTATTDLTTGNIGVVSDGAGTLNIRLAKTLTGLTSAAFTDGTHTVTIAGSGIDAGNTEIKHVGKATTDDAAVNKKQMDDAVKAATDSVSTLGDNKVSLGSDSGTTTAKKLSTTGGIKFNIKGDTGANALITTSATGDDVTIAPTAKLSAAVTAAENSANKDLSNLSTAGNTYIQNLAKSAASWNVETNGAGTTAVAGGDTVNFINGDNIAITNTGRSITIGTAKNVSFDKVTVGGVVIDKNNGIDAGGKEITNVGPATSGNSAVNKTQMDTAITNAVNKATTDAKHDFGGDDATVVTRKHGEKLNIKGGASTTAADLTSGNIAVLGDATTGTLNIRMAKALTGLSSATFTTPSGTTVVNGGGMTITPSTTGAAPISITTGGINAGNTEIKNVAAGTTPNSAVNKQQMDSAISNATANVGFSTAGNTGTGSVSNGQTLSITGTNGIETNASGQSITVGLDAATRAQINNATTTANNAAKKDLSNIDNAGKQVIKDTAAWNVKVNSGTPEIVKGGDTVTFNDGDNIKVTNTGKDITIATKKDVSFDKVTVGNVVIDKNTNRISGLANAANNDEAVNLGQMNAAISTATAGTGNIKYKANGGTQNSVALTTGFDFKGDSNIQITADPANSGVINYKLNPALTGITSISGGTGGPTITLNAGSGSTPGNVSINSNLDMGGKQINNIGAATHAGDAVNKAQMDQALQNIAGASSNAAKSYAYKAGAGAAALAALKPIQYDPLEPTQIMAGVGNYKSQTAVALGVAHYTNENTMFNLGVSLDSHDGIVNAGVTHKFGYSPEKKAIPDKYKGGPISSIYVMQDEVTALQAIVQKQAAENEALRQQNEDMQRKVDMILSKIH